MEGLKDFLSVTHGSGSGSGSGDGYINGSGDGSGYGDGYSNGSGDGSGSGYGDGYGYGSGDGSGYGDGSGVFAFSGSPVVDIDGVQTIAYELRFGALRGAFLNDDLTITPCWVVKGGDMFAHGPTLREAKQALDNKLLVNEPMESRIAKFNEAYKDNALTGAELSRWHHRLTGSCQMGRDQFIKRKGIDLDKTYTKQEFANLVRGAYGWSTLQPILEA